MKTLQECFEQRYPTPEAKEQIKEIDVYQQFVKKSKKPLDGRKLDLSEYPNLEVLEIDGVELSKKLIDLKLGSKPKLRELYCSNNQLAELDLTNCFTLEKLSCDNNQLTKLDLSKLGKLTKLDCGNNQLTELNVQNCPNLKELQCSANFLSNLVLDKNGKLEEFNIRNNDFKEQDLSFLKSLVNLKLL